MKKTKKGFTLIELLAVIAILGVLAIVAVPSIVNLFNTAKQNTFMSQAKNIFQAATDKYMADQLGTTAVGARTYCHGSGGNGAYTLDISGNQGVYYKVAFDASGNITSFQVKDDKYGFEDASGPVVITDVTGTPGTAASITLTC